MSWYHEWIMSKEFGDLLKGETYPMDNIDKKGKIKTASAMMDEHLELCIDNYGNIEMDFEQSLEIYRWYQSVELAQVKRAAMSKHAKRTDTNQPEIVDALRKAGYEVKITSMYGLGFPDCIVAGGGRVVMFEIKYGDEKLTDAEKEFFYYFGGLGVFIVRSAEEALQIMQREMI